LSCNPSPVQGKFGAKTSQRQKNGRPKLNQLNRICHLHNIAVVVKIGTQHYDKFALSNAVAAIHSIQKYDAEEVMMVRHRILKCKIMSKKKDLQGLGRPTSIIVSIRAMLIIKGKVSTYLHELKHSKLVSMER